MQLDFTTVLVTTLTVFGSFITGWLVFRNKSRDRLDESLFKYVDSISDRLDKTEKELKLQSEELKSQGAELTKVRSKLMQLENVQFQIKKSLSRVEATLTSALQHLKHESPKIPLAIDLIETSSGTIRALNQLLKESNDS